MQERRSSARIRAFMARRIATGDGDTTLDCVVRDLTETGARLLVDDPSRAPRDFHLAVSLSGESYLARVVWQSETAVGVIFSQAAGHMPSSRSCDVVSIAAVRAARHPVADRDCLAERMARVSRPAPRARPAWAWPAMVR